ncbi:hypothetical protein [Streptomyces sp. ID05-39B]|uniref:hypothetical protein n=1 Tax=Streptomyces sp. ID05-39B TaxID=3028664 RepID=UPI0034DB06CF
MDLLRWYRFLWAVEMCWDQATRAEARDFCRWPQLADKPVRVHWRHQRKGITAPTVPAPRMEPGTPNPVTGRAAPGRKYAPSTRAHCETVLRTFYDFHLDEGTGPIINPLPAGPLTSQLSGSRTPQSVGDVPSRTAGPLPAEGAQAHPAADPG